MDDYKSEIRKISMSEFFPAIVHMKTDKWRLVQICATTVAGGYDMVTLRLEPKDDEGVASITQICPCAYIQENEAAELFGVKIGRIKPDYQDRLYRIDQTAPFKNKE